MSEYALSLGSRLRAIRNQQGLSLQAVEAKSGGRWKAVVIGSYERGDRSVTVQKLRELAQFYDVPMTELLPDARPEEHDREPVAERAPSDSGRVVLDLTRLGSMPSDEGAPVVRYARSVQDQRGDYNGRVLTIRADDMRSLAVVYGDSTDGLTERLRGWGVLAEDCDGRSPDRDYSRVG